MSETKPTVGELFHVVCHDCPHERLVDDGEEARTLVDDHAAETGHAVEAERVA
ncbi:MAG: hypothetical protein ABEJ81_03820 [Haloferacaceae archaeon]